MTPTTMKLLELADTIPDYGRKGLIDEIVKAEKSKILFSMDDISKRFGVDIRTVKDWKAKGLLIPSQNASKFIRFSLEDIENFQKLTRKEVVE